VSRAEWIDGMRRAGVRATAAALGAKVSEPRTASGGAFSPCPVCAAEFRHAGRGDRRRACGVRRDDHGWHCFGCDASGDSIHLVALCLRGRRFDQLDLLGKIEVRKWCEEFIGAPQSVHYAQSASVVHLPVEPPPQTQVDSLWASCARIEAGSDTAKYLEFRGLRPDLVRERDTARQLPDRRHRVPAWAHSWRATGHELIVPLFNYTGQMCTVIARSTEPHPRLKSRAPKGFGRAGLIMADAAAREILATGSWPASFVGRDPLIVIVEGEVDYLAAIQTSGSAAVAHFAIVSGAWTQAHATRIPVGATVIVATDQDPQGEKYAHTIASTFCGRRVDVRRWRPNAASQIEAQS